MTRALQKGSAPKAMRETNGTPEAGGLVTAGHEKARRSGLVCGYRLNIAPVMRQL